MMKTSCLIVCFCSFSLLGSQEGFQDFNTVNIENRAEWPEVR